MFNGTVPARVSMDNVHVIGVVGIIGVSKSTAIDMLEKSGTLSRKLIKRNAHVCFFQEPSREWRTKGYLQAFYENPAENAAAFQIIVFASAVRAFEELVAEMRKMHPDPQTPIVVIADRTHIDQLLFWNLQCDRGNSNWLMNEAYMGVWELWRRFVPIPRHILFFQTSTVQQCMQRLAERANAPHNDGTEVTEVNGVTIEYQTQLFAKHCRWYTTPLAHPPFATPEGIPCTHINVDADFRHDADAFAQLEIRVWEEIKQLFPKIK
jgi:deoxyadenosine/deoxycytidine kinase